jgi:hypothetical protein
MSHVKPATTRKRVGRVSLYEHHGAWWIYHRDGGQPCRRNVGGLALAECEASLLNTQLVAAVIAEDLGRIMRRSRVVAFCESCEDHKTRVIAINDDLDTNRKKWRRNAFWAAMKHEESNEDTSDRLKLREGTALCVPGNHDEKLLRKLRGKDVQITHGLAETLHQLSTRPPEYHRQVHDFIDALIGHYVLDDGRLVVAHAGMRSANRPVLRSNRGRRR